MNTPSKAVKIFVASAGDLPDERNRIVQIIHQVSKLHRHLTFDTVKWETDIESGRYDTRIQSRINDELNTCDILLFLVNKRIGKFSLEEYKLAVKKKKKIFIYFQKFPSASNTQEAADLIKVFEFKEELNKENKTLYLEFENLDQLETKITRDLNLFLEKAFPADADSKQLPADTITVVPKPETNWLDPIISFLRANWKLTLSGILLILFIFDFSSYYRFYKNMVLIPAGEYMLGRKNDSPLLDFLEKNKDHLKESPYILETDSLLYDLKEGFYISKFEVTNKEYREFLESLKSKNNTQYILHKPYLHIFLDTIQRKHPELYNYFKPYLEDELPVLGVSYDDAIAYAKWKGMSLPDSYQWEIAARSNNPNQLTLFPWGNDFVSGISNTSKKNGSKKKEVKPLPVNSSEVGITHGIFGLIGNADEWVYTEEGETAEIRGGHFDIGGAVGGVIHNKRYKDKSDKDKTTYFYNGFRLAVRESNAIDKNTSGMVFFKAGKYPLGYKIKSPLLKLCKEVKDVAPGTFLNQVVFPFAEENKVNIKVPFYIDKYEVSVEKYENFLNYLERNPGHKSDNVSYDILREIRNQKELFEPDLAVTGVSWDAANAYAKWKGKKLPSVEQMAIAIAGPNNHLFPWGDNWCSKCCNDINYEKEENETYILPVESLLLDKNTMQSCVSWCGAFHLTGNVKEWLDNSPPEERKKAFFAGGSWKENCQAFGLSFYNFAVDKDSQSDFIGFRCAANAPHKFTWKIYQALFAKLL
ncbi:MAG: hypothetical protein DYG98_18375 [Haliscomenobacteraceae bacterium CHB4]|nr:hypothetical protein [Haliscomenobacteraceae bacterium CHB4]